MFSRKAGTGGAVPAPQGIPGGNAAIFTYSDIEANTTATRCVNILAFCVSILPLNLIFRNPTTGSRQRAGWHPLYAVLKRRPNLRDTPITFFGRLMRHIFQKGNAYIFVSPAPDGTVLSLALLNPVYVTEDYSTPGTVRYHYGGATYSDWDPASSDPTARILHIPSIIVDDWGCGKAFVDLAKAAVRMGKKIDLAAENSFDSGLNSNLQIDVDPLAHHNDEKALATYARSVSDYVVGNYAGTTNAGKPFVNIFGKDAVTELKNQRSNREAELLPSRQWQTVEICKIFGVPPFLVDGTFDVKYGNLESAMTVFLNFGLMPWLLHLAQSFARLLTPYEQQDDAYYFEHDVAALLRADSTARGDFYYKLFSMGAISPGEIDAKENMDPPAEGADARFVPANMMPLRKDVLDAYMAGAKAKAAGLVAGGPVPDPALKAGSQAQ